MLVGIIGGGAAGFFAAISVKVHYPKSEVIIFEKSNKLLSKVKISGGGRCNVTNGRSSLSALSRAYPRGEKFLKKAFHVFDNKDAMEWYEKRGVPLVIQPDNCVFPKSQNSQSIIDCLLNESRKLKIQILLNRGVKSIAKNGNKWVLSFIKEDKDMVMDKLIIATGGSPRIKGLQWIADTGHQIIPPVPSLFTFNMPQEPIRKLMGIVVNNAIAKIQGTKLSAQGPLLVTHWGMSGPAILKLSAFGARLLADKNYQFTVQVNWIDKKDNNSILNGLEEFQQQHGKKQMGNVNPFALQERLWLYFLERVEISSKARWGDMGRKSFNRLINVLTNDSYQVSGKTTFKEEFVTCGGVDLLEIDHKTMQSKICDNLYFAGEVMDIDGITGGYNFQAAWTTGFIAGRLL